MYLNLEKCSKKERKAYYNAQRGSWNGVNPVTRVTPNKGKNAYNRQAAKRECRVCL